MGPSSFGKWSSFGGLELAQPGAPLTSYIPGHGQFEAAAGLLALGHNPLGFQL